MKSFNARFGAWALLLSLLGSPFVPILTAQSFTNVTATVALGLPRVVNGSVAWGDYDNDGRLDFLLTGGVPGVDASFNLVSQLWRNTGIRFTNVTATVAPGLPGVASSAVAWGDYDKDGFLDLLLSGSGFSQLWRNTGSGFTDMTDLIALGLPGVRSASVAWVDYDNDGLLDFMLAGEDASGIPVVQLWRNTADEFVNVTDSVAPGLRGVSDGAMAWGDYDKDGRLDLLITGKSMGSDSNYISISEIWRNTGSEFSNMTATVASGLPGIDHSSVGWADYDKDGRLDFLITGRTDEGYPVSQLWRNTESGFTNGTASVAPGLPGVDSGSVAWGDYDNDGRLDFLLTGRTSEGYPLSQLWRNTGSGFTAKAVPGLPGVKSGSVAWADYNNDGRLDFLITGGTNASNSGAISQLWRNNGAQSNPPPTINTYVPALVSQDSVALNGAINPRGEAATVWFIWGNNTNYGQVTPPQSVGNGNSFSNFSQTITGLSTGVTYYYRAVGSNAQGQVFQGFEERFIFAAPGVTTIPVWNISQTAATLNGQANPNNLPAYGWFEWGLTPAYGQVTPAQFLGHGFGASFGQYLFGLAGNTTYYFRAVASNSLGVAYGAAQSLVTLGCFGSVTPGGRSHGYDPEPNYAHFYVACDWTVINTNSWITITSPTNGTAGYGTLFYTPVVNTDPQPRSGYITIGDIYYWVEQAGGHPVIVAQPLDQTVLVGGTATFNVTLDGTAPVTCQWQFDHVPLTNGIGISGASTTNLVLTGIQESQAGQYRVLVAGLYSYSATLTVSCGFALSAGNASFNSFSATGSVTLNTVATNCGWSIVNTNPWVAILSGITNMGNGTVVYSLAANPTTMARSGSIMIADQTFMITQSGGAITNETISLAKALDTEGTLTWDTIGTPDWFGQTLFSKDGVDAAQSGAIGNSAAVTALSTITGPGTLSFWWKVSSQTNKDFLKLFINGVQQTRISGEVDWQLLRYTFPSGTYTSKWTYAKNASVAVGHDRGWLDQVQFLAQPGCVVTLSHTNATHSSASETGQVSVAAANGCTWNIINLSSWISPVVDESNGFVRYTLATNSSPVNRTGFLIIAGQMFTVVQLSDPAACGYSISPGGQAHNPSPATGVVSVITQPGCAWTVLNSNPWVTILSSSSSSGSGQVLYSLADNTASTAGRTGVVLIAGQPFTVSQPPGIIPCTYSISPTNRVHGYGATNGVISVTTQAGCEWSVVNTNPWVTILSSTNGSGSGQVSYSVSANTSTFVRSGYIHIAGRVLSISQSPPITFAEAIDVVGTSLVVGNTNSGVWSAQSAVTHDGVDAAVGTGNGIFTLVANGPGTLTFWWKVSSQTNSNLRFYLGGSEQVRISGEVDWAPHTVSIPAGIQNLDWFFGKNAAGDRAWVDQVQFVPGISSNCSITLSPSSRMHGSAGTTNTVVVTTQNGCPWSVVNTNSWISILSNPNSSSSGVMFYSLLANTNLQSRSGNIIIGGRNFFLTQSGPPSLQIIGRTATSATFSMQGEPFKMYVIESSEDLIHWIPISTNSAPSTITDAAVGTAPHRFYRTVQIP